MSLPGAHPEVCTGVTSFLFFIFFKCKHKLVFFVVCNGIKGTLSWSWQRASRCDITDHARKKKKKEKNRRAEEKVAAKYSSKSNKWAFKKKLHRVKTHLPFHFKWLLEEGKKNVFPSLSGFLQNKKKIEEGGEKISALPCWFSLREKQGAFFFLSSPPPLHL